MTAPRRAAWIAAALIGAAALPLAAQVSSGAPLESVRVGHGAWRVVLLHGYGAPGDDLLPVARTLASTVPGATFVVPAAPTPAHGGGGRVWYELEQPDTDAQEADAVARLDALVDVLVAEGVPSEHVIVGGFSQGAILSLDLARVGRHHLGGVALLSGRAVPHAHADDTRLAGLPVFSAHGRRDARIPFARGEAAVELARAAGADVTFVPFDGVHEIPASVIDALGAWLRARVSAR